MRRQATIWHLFSMMHDALDNNYYPQVAHSGVHEFSFIKISSKRVNIYINNCSNKLINAEAKEFSYQLIFTFGDIIGIIPNLYYINTNTLIHCSLI